MVVLGFGKMLLDRIDFRQLLLVVGRFKMLSEAFEMLLGVVDVVIDRTAAHSHDPRRDGLGTAQVAVVMAGVRVGGVHV